MPYIKQDRRFSVDPMPSHGTVERAKTAGELNFQLTRICMDYLETWPVGYQQYNDVIGALEGCKLEFYARVVRPYEDTKIEENGDVY